MQKSCLEDAKNAKECTFQCETNNRAGISKVGWPEQWERTQEVRKLDRNRVVRLNVPNGYEPRSRMNCNFGWHCLAAKWCHPVDQVQPEIGCQYKPSKTNDQIPGEIQKRTENMSKTQKKKRSVWKRAQDKSVEGGKWHQWIRIRTDNFEPDLKKAAEEGITLKLYDFFVSDPMATVAVCNADVSWSGTVLNAQKCGKNWTWNSVTWTVCAQNCLSVRLVHHFVH